MNRFFKSANENNDKLNMRYIPMEHIKLYTKKDSIIINDREIGYIDEENAGFVTKSVWKGLAKQILKTNTDVNCLVDKIDGKMQGLFCIINSREFNKSFMESSLQLFKSKNNLNTIIDEADNDKLATAVDTAPHINTENSKSYCFGEVLDESSVEKLRNSIPNIQFYNVHNCIYVKYEERYALSVSEHNVMPLKYIRDERTILDLQKR